MLMSAKRRRRGRRRRSAAVGGRLRWLVSFVGLFCATNVHAAYVSKCVKGDLDIFFVLALSRRRHLCVF